MHHTDVPAVLVQRGGGSETTEIPVDEPSPTTSPAFDNEPGRGVEYESNDHTPQKRKRTSTTECLQGFLKYWLTKFDWLTYNSVNNSMGCRLCHQQRCEGMRVSGTRNVRVKIIALHAVSKIS